MISTPEIKDPQRFFEMDSEYLEYLRDFFDNGPVGFHVFGPDKII